MQRLRHYDPVTINLQVALARPRSCGCGGVDGAVVYMFPGYFYGTERKINIRMGYNCLKI
jgi:hypothetical protein